MNKIMFNITKKISYKLDGYALRLVKNGATYNKHKRLFHVLDDLSRGIYNFGYNTFVIGRW